MFKRKRIKFLVVIFLVVTLIIGGIAPSFADSGNVFPANDSKTTVQVINDNSVIISENDERTLITETNNKNESITTLKNLETGSEDYFIRDEIKGTIYSSITGKTINIDDDIDENINNKELYFTNERFYSQRSSNQRYLGRRYVKYSTIKNLVDGGAYAGAIAAAVLAYLKVPITAGTKLIVAVLAGLGGLTALALSVKYPRGGLRLDLYEVRKYKMQRGKKYYFWSKTYKNVKHLSVI